MSRVVVVASLLCALTSGCGPALLSLVDPPPPADTGEGEGEGEGEGAGIPTGCDAIGPDAAVPVKVLFLVDVASSTQFTDQPGLRRNLVRDAVARLRTRVDVQVATMGFGSDVYVAPVVTSPADPVFEPVSNWSEPAFLGAQDIAGDLHLALTAARRQILDDALQQDLTTSSVTRYVVYLLTDGAVGPVCCTADGASTGDIAASDDSGCALESWEAPDAATTYCGGQAEAAACTSQDALDGFRQGAAAALEAGDVDGNAPGAAAVAAVPDFGDGPVPPLDGLVVGEDYQRTAQLSADAADLAALGGSVVGAVDLHVVGFDDPTLSDVVKSTFGLNSCRMQTTLEAVAAAAGGTYADASSGDDGSLTDADTAPLCARP